MRYKITLKTTDAYTVIPINYQYELSSCILGICKDANTKYQRFLKQHKLPARRKNFQWFSFSNLYVPRREIFADRLQVISPKISFIISFYLDPSAERFIKDLFLDRQMYLGDKFSQARFIVENVEPLPLRMPSTTVSFKTLSPLLISKLNNRGNVDYLPPEHPEYENLFLQALLGKYVKVLQETNQTPESSTHQRIEFEVNHYKKIKSRLITVKAHTTNEARIRGFMYEFRLTAPKEIIELGLLTGFGEKNRLGFGACETVY
ncbi:CRISPR-associated endoribonuclease Cas6 [Microscilla marina]|uniref:CRISPR-associated endoribonuclease n=1 Tax=Microscilla marina ATCC 23134 TaxID=313606 RepID=A1ZPF3_MICM2|nr:CRISPR-associated endoribonuclease Cas6 [Microscilla marina]EAY27692.1 crispr-associated protein Cas6 [Microscilla marina ATCC 23134]